MTKIQYKPGLHLADVYLELKAQQAELAEREKALREAILKMGMKTIEGEFGRVNVIETAPGRFFDAAKAKAYLSPEIIERCQSYRDGSIRFDVRARVADPRVAA
jgi:hypothetical protein